MNIQYGTIKTWPGKLRGAGGRTPAPFKSDYRSTIALLERELSMIDARSPVVQLATTHFRRDNGLPYADMIPEHPGVIVSFIKHAGRDAQGNVLRHPLSFPCDTFKGWQNNLRAIALGLEALRKVDRYGVTQNGEQYTGFKALPPPGPEHPSVLTIDEAARFLAGLIGHDYPADVLIKSVDNYRTAYRAAAPKFHPDGTTPDEETWARLQAAKNLLDTHHGV